MHAQSLTVSELCIRARAQADDRGELDFGASCAMGAPTPYTTSSLNRSLHLSGIAYGFSVRGLS